jgi:hypothetical protein
MSPRLVTYCALLSLAGCATLRPVQSSVDVPATVHIELHELKGDLIILEVINPSMAPLMVNRDAMVLKTSREVLKREPGGASSVYTLMPAGHHRVNLKFMLGSIAAGETVQLAFDQAITQLGGGAVPVPPLTFIKE